MKGLFLTLCIVSVFFWGCETAPAPTPVIIRTPPESEMREDMTIEEYLYSSTRYRIEVEKYLEELINQIIHKVPYIDLRTPSPEEEIPPAETKQPPETRP